MSIIRHKLSKLDALIHDAAVLHTQVTARPIHINDLIATFCVSFLKRELEHARAVEQLVEIGEVSSTAVLARTMLEGAACAWWVMKAENPRGRAGIWRRYVYHESLKALDEHEPIVQGRTNIYDIKREAQKAQARGKTFKERRWTVDENGKTWSAKEVVENLVEHEPHMRRGVYAYYQGMSAFTHWSPSAFSIDEQSRRNAVWEEEPFPDDFIAAALSTADFSLYLVATFAANHFGSSADTSPS